MTLVPIILEPLGQLLVPGLPTSTLALLQVVSSICIICIFILSGLGLKTDEVKTAVVQGKAIVYAFVSINFMTGCVALIMMQLPFVPQELSIGLSVFCAMPTTLSSGAVLVRPYVPACRFLVCSSDRQF